MTLHPFRSRYLSRVVLYAGTFGILAALNGCGGGSSTASASTSTATTLTQSTIQLPSQVQVVSSK